MSGTIIFLDHEKSIPPFLISSIEYASTRYEHVFYVNTRKPVNSQDLTPFRKVQVLYPSWPTLFMSLVMGGIKFLSKECRRQFFQYYKCNGFSLAYIKRLLRVQAVESVLNIQVSKIIKKSQKDEKICVIAVWFATAALSAARLKMRFKTITAVSLAHSYDVLVSRDKFIPFLFVGNKHQYLDGIFFIAYKIRDMYLDGIGGLSKPYLDKVFVSYLGSFNRTGALNKVRDNEFHLCTCSRTIPLKRLDLLVKALSYWNNTEIFWTHIGDGESLDELVVQSQEIMNSNANVHISFTGYLNCEQITDFYIHEPVDLFVNLSSIEGLPVSIMEAISFGIPILATDVGGTNEIVNSQLGVLLDEKVTAEDVFREIESFVLLPKSRKEELRKNARIYWEQHFDAHKNLHQLFSKIESLNL